MSFMQDIKIQSRIFQLEESGRFHKLLQFIEFLY